MYKYCILILLLFCLFSNAQNLTTNTLDSKYRIPMLEFESPSDISQLLEQDVQKGERFRFAKMISCNISADTHGEWREVEGGIIWQIAVKATNAKGISLYFNEFWIPAQAHLYIYNVSQSQKLGPFTSKNNHNSGFFASPLIYDDTIILEYFQPNSEQNLLKLNINRFAYAYKDISGGELGGFNSSDDCQVNANCSEGDNWENQKKSVCRIQIPDGNFVGLCSGALINNTTNDCTPYVLSADHCFDGGNISNNNLNQTIFYFNYRSSGCNNSVPNNTYSITGCQKLANSGGQGENGDSDFFLVELNNEPDFDPYFSGWNRSNTPASSGVSIHHPSGDIMKISTFTNTLSSSGGLGFGNNFTTHWMVNWSSTANGHGVTEGGSSGSPIFNQNGLIVGDLTGGASFCEATNQSDIYGKLWHGWDQMGNSTDQQLKPWLDPTNTGVTSLNGMFCNQSTQVTAAFSSTEANICRNSSVTFTSLSSGNISTYNWTFPGGVPSSANGPGPHTISYSTLGNHNVSLEVVGPDNSDTYFQNNYVSVAPNSVELDFLPDCYGEEITWMLENANNQTLYSISSGYYPGGSSTSTMEANPVAVQEQWCLMDGCYTFTVEDDYGDGLYGSQHSCNFNGDFTIYDELGAVLTELNSPNSNFGDNISLEFCVYSNVSVEKYENTKWLVYPNPSNGFLTLDSPKRGALKIYNHLLQLVYEANKNKDILSIELGNVKKGIYFIHLDGDIQKLVIQ